MASFRQRGTNWQARVKRDGFPDQVKSFEGKAEAERWARSVESEMDRGSYTSPASAQKTTLGDLIQRYMVKVLPNMKGAHDDAIRLKAICRRPICKNSIASLTPAKIAEYRDLRLTEVAAGTVVRELAYLSSIINHGRREWGIHANNPVALVRKPTQPKGRERILSLAERERLLAELQPTGRRNMWMLFVVIVALETGMRRSELLALRWGDINLDRQTATPHTTKNGDSRVVPLSTKAGQTLTFIPRSICGAVFPITACALAGNFGKAVARAQLPDLHFHDLRHTGITLMGWRNAYRASADAMTLSLAGSPPETPEAIARVQAQLAHLDADCDYERWRNVVWSVLSTAWECAEDKAREWSRTANTRYNEDTFCQLVKSFDPSRGITLGTLDHLAREGGWSPAAAAPRASQANQVLDQHNKTTRLLTASQLKALPLMAWRIRGLLPMRGLASMYGSSGSGKTFLALDVACAIATGQPQWFGAKITAAPVAYVALEGEAGIRQRVTAWEQHHGQQVTERLRFVLGNYTLMDPQDSAFLANEIIESLGTGAVVFIDTLNQAAPGADENTSADMGRIITNAKALATAVDGIVVLVHHAGKDATRGMRGHSSLFAAMDAVIEVKNTVNGRTWNLAKSKDSVSGVALGFELVHHIVGDDEDGLNISSCAVSPMLPLSPTRKPVGGKNQIAALAALSRMAADHSNGVPTKLAHQAVATTLDGPANRKSTKAKQLIQAMTESGHLRQENEGVFVN